MVKLNSFSSHESLQYTVSRPQTMCSSPRGRVSPWWCYQGSQQLSWNCPYLHHVRVLYKKYLKSEFYIFVTEFQRRQSDTNIKIMHHMLHIVTY